MRLFNHNISNIRIVLFLSAFLVCASLSAQTAGVGEERDKDKVKVEVYPNPTSEQITIDLSKTEVTKPVIEIRSIIGSKMQIILENAGIKKYKVDVSRFPRGYYLVLVREDREKFQQTIRFSKK